MKLVIAEKPSVAQSLSAVIGATARKDGYLEGNGWRVSWCVGHLAGLADADSYDPKYAKWRYDDLPILPEHWQMVVGKDKKKQFDILKKLMNAPDVTEVVNACDAGREGELIFRSVYELAGCQKPMKRLWISSMEDSAIREGFANLRPGVDYDGLRDAALCRAKADWLVGINATRLFSVLYHRTLNIGRVMSPTLALIVQREAEIDTFKPVPFYTVALELPGLTVSGERMADKAAAEQLKEVCQGAAVTIKKVECKEKSEKPPALYDLTTLQRDANRLLGFTAQQTLDYLQSLYEKKLCTYPRTDSRYLTGDMADSLPVLVNLVANAMPFRKGIAITCDPQPVINDKKVTDHHAVIPTRNLKDADLSALPAGEKAVLELVALRLLCAVAQPHIYSETVVIADCAGGEFTAKGKTVKHPGWKALEDAYRAKMKDAEPKKRGRRESPAGADRRTDPFGFCGNRQRRQKQSAPALYGGHPIVRDGDCRKRRYAGGCRTKRSGDTGHPCRYFGKAGICRFSGTKKEQENGAASPFPRCSFPYHRSAGTAAIAAFDCRVGVPPGRDRARAACPGGVFGRDQHHVGRPGGDLSGHQGNRVPVLPAP